MSDYKVPVTKILSIETHPDKDVTSLEIATVFGYKVVVKKGMYSVGDFVVYIPVDSVLPTKLESLIFGENSKIKLHKSRVRQIRIRKFPSQGMLLSALDFHRYVGNVTNLKDGQDVSSILGITKYEPPIPEYQSQLSGKKTRKNVNNPLFHSYNGLSNIKWYPSLFEQDEEVVIQEKLHGSSARMAKLPTVIDTLWKKVKNFFGLLPKYEVCYGSNNVDLTNRESWTGYYDKNIYALAFQECKADEKIKPNEIIYGEVVCEGIQKNYHYGHRTPHFVLFDVKKYNEETKEFYWLSPEEVEAYAKERGFDMVPVLYRGVFNKQIAYELTLGDSVYCSEQKVREGVVIKSRLKYNDISMSSNKRALKYISEVYLDKDNSDFH